MQNIPMCRSVIFRSLFLFNLSVFCLATALHAQDTTRYHNILRGYSFDFSNVDFPNYPVIQYHFPGGPSKKFTKLAPLVDQINGVALDKLSRKEIIAMMLTQDTAELIIRHHGCRTKADCKNPPKTWEASWQDPNPKELILPALNGTNTRVHPLGLCLTGDCINGKGYILAYVDSTNIKRHTSYAGTFQDGKLYDGYFRDLDTIYTYKNGLLVLPDKKVPPVTPGAVTVSKPAIDSVAEAYLKFGSNEVMFYKKQQVWDRYDPLQIVFANNNMYEPDLIYTGELWGHTPHGRGKIEYARSSVSAPMPGPYQYKMITEGTFVYGDVEKTEKLYVQDFSGYYLKGPIYIYHDRYHNVFYYSSDQCGLYNMNYINAAGEEVQQETLVFTGKYMKSEPYGPGRWYFSEDARDPLYGAYIEMPNIDRGFVTDSIILVHPTLKERTNIPIGSSYVPLENVADFARARYYGDTRNILYWKRGNPQPVEVVQQDNFDLAFKGAADAFLQLGGWRYIDQQKIYSYGSVASKTLTFTLDAEKQIGVLVISAKETTPVIEGSDNSDPRTLRICADETPTQDNLIKVTAGCHIINLTGRKENFHIRITAKTLGEPLYYVVFAMN